MGAVNVLLRDLVAERTGIYVEDYNLDIFMEKLSPLILERGFASPLDYFYLLKYDSEAVTEWSRVADAISVRETFFWREIDQIQALVDHMVPEFFARHPAGRLRIWSAACASGEEPLTIAIALREAGLWDHPISIVASDASPAAIRTARSGLYRERSFRNMPQDLWDRYFRREAGNWKVDPEIHAHIIWSNVNLMNEDEIAPLAVSNVIFCRNVFLYFKADTIKRIVQTFARQMRPPAYLCVGAAESLLKLTTQFELKEIGRAFVYAKVGG